MLILDRQISRQDLHILAANCFGDMVKGVVDVDKGILALDAELHADLEAMLLEQGSQQGSLWGINLYPEMDGADFLEFGSLINIRPMQGNRSRGVEDKAIQTKIKELVEKWIRE